MLWRNPSPGRRPPGFIEPCIPTRVDKPPVGPQWIHEIKHDGYRLIVRKGGDRVRLFTRRGYDWTDRYPLIAKAVAALREHAVVIDGEVVICDDAGVANFEMLHGRAHDDRAFLYAFDLLEVGGLDCRPHPLHVRKKRLQQVLRKSAAGIQFNEHLTGDGARIFEHACKLGFEGIVSKHSERPYQSGPSKAWLKIRNPKAPGVLRFEDRE
jgi:bifunctional non-homologous end joining protein LigD